MIRERFRNRSTVAPVLACARGAGSREQGSGRWIGGTACLSSHRPDGHLWTARYRDASEPLPAGCSASGADARRWLR